MFQFPGKFPKTCKAVFWMAVILLILLSVGKLLPFFVLSLGFFCFIYFILFNKEEKQRFKERVKMFWKKMN